MKLKGRYVTKYREGRCQFSRGLGFCPTMTRGREDLVLEDFVRGELCSTLKKLVFSPDIISINSVLVHLVESRRTLFTSLFGFLIFCNLIPEMKNEIPIFNFWPCFHKIDKRNIKVKGKKIKNLFLNDYIKLRMRGSHTSLLHICYVSEP